ncbi:MAG TPA: hypothetical protein VMW27_29475 [Thermoanaerobaculia bacterium]|nr:hypothetical protein [Thermoanaerobaculia bacterium]
MEVTNTTGLDGDFKVTSGGGTRDGGGWKPLPRRSRVEHALEKDEGPWKIEFRIPDHNKTYSGRFINPPARVVLEERSGEIHVDMKLQ